MVFDPFAGSGTTGVEAVRLGRNAVVSDRLSVSRLIAEAKVTLITSGMDVKALREVKAALTFDQQCRSNQYGSKGEGLDSALVDWYAADTLAQLRFLWRLIETLPIRARKVLIAVFSDVLFQ